MFILQILGQWKIAGNFGGFGKVKTFNKTLLGEAGCRGNPYFLLARCLGIQFFEENLMAMKLKIFTINFWLQSYLFSSN